MKESQLLQYKEEIQPVLLPDEEIISIYGLFVDFAAITNKRLLFMDKSVTSKNKSLITIPFSKISSVSLVNVKNLMVSVYEIEISTGHRQFDLKFANKDLLTEFYKTITTYIL
jgi:hypothetical protein